MIQLSLPWPPSINHYYRPMAAGRKAFITMTKEARMYRQEVFCAVRKALGPNIQPMTVPVRLDVELRAPDRRRRDLDNPLKGILDGITHAGLWADDSQVDELTVRRGQIIKDGMVCVLIAELDPQ